MLAVPRPIASGNAAYQWFVPWSSIVAPMPARWPVLALWIIRLPEQRLNVRKIDGFWDSSAIVPLCVDQGASPIAKTARKSQSISV